MKKCYIAGKIGNLRPEVYEELFMQGEIEVLKLGMNPVSPLKLPHIHEKTWSAYMKEDMIAMLKCQAVYLLSNWSESPGATIERETALKVGIPVIYQLKE